MALFNQNEGFIISAETRNQVADSDYILMIDLNGTLYKILKADFLAGSSNKTGSNAGGSSGINLTFSASEDTNGLFYYLGTVGNIVPWANPTSRGLTIQASTAINGSVESLVNRDESQFYTDNLPSSWVSFNIGTKKLKCNYYSIRARNAANYYLRNWKLQGSNDGATWVDLDTQTNNTTLANASQWLSIPINNTAAYSWFRILNYGLDSEGYNFLTLGEVELYGEYFA